MAKKIKFVEGEMYEYDLYPLTDKYDDILRQKLEPFYFEDSADHPRTPILARNLAVSLIETMRENYGVGLAANQVGIPYRVFVMGADNVGYAMFNPEILETTGEVLFEEGCLTWRGLYLPIRRPETVHVRYQDMNGVTQEKRFTGLSARIVLHEYDHLEGQVFVDKVPVLILDRAKKKVPTNLKKLKKQREREMKEDLIAKAIKSLSMKANTV